LSRSKYVVPLIVLVVSASLEGLAYLQLQMRYVELQNNYDGIKVLYSTLNSSYHLLNMNYERLSREYFEAQSNLESVTQSLVVLQSQHADLLEDYGSLEKKYEELRRSYLSLETTHKIDEVMRIGNSLESYYDVVRAEKGPKRWWTEQMRVNFCADLAMHDLGRNVWPTLESNYVEIAGEHSYETAKRKIDAIINIIGVSEEEPPTGRIRKILWFIHTYVTYEREIDDVNLAPAEVLGLRSGDCDDFSVLAASLFEAVGIDAAVGLFKNEENSYHSMVLVHLEALAGYDYLFFADLTSKGLEAGRWIIIEPQVTIENQSSSWVKQWTLIAAAPLD